MSSSNTPTGTGNKELLVPMVKTATGQYMAQLPGGAHVVQLPTGGFAVVKSAADLFPKPKRPAGPVKPGKSAGPKLLEPNMEGISFRPPSGVKQTVTLKLKHTRISSKPVAFKIKTNKPGIYSVRPGDGIIDHDQSVQVDVELAKTFTPADFKNDNKNHEIHLLGIKWPKKIDEYDITQWRRLEKARHGEQQRFVFKIDFQGKSNESKKGGEVIAGPTHILVTPPMVALSPPKTKTRALTLANQTNNTVAYKIQTNRPKFYVVNPNKGLLKPMEKGSATIEVNQNLAAKDIEGDNENHQFMLMVIPWTANEFNAEEFAVMIQKSKKDVQKQKINVELKVEGDNYYLGVIPSRLSYKRPTGTSNANGQVIPVKLMNRSERVAAFKIISSHSVMNKFYTPIPTFGIVEPNSGFQCTIGFHPGFQLSDLPGDRAVHYFEVKAIYWPLPIFNEDLWEEFEEGRKEDMQQTKIYIDFDGLDKCDGQLLADAGGQGQSPAGADGGGNDENWIVKEKPSDTNAFISQMIAMQMQQMGMETGQYEEEASKSRKK